MTKKNVTLNYNGEVLKDDEVLVAAPYDEFDVAENVSNKDSIITVSKIGVSVKAILKAVPKKFESEAKAQFNFWQRDQMPKVTKGRCMIPQGDGTYKECPKKKGDNRVSCENCSHRGKYERKEIGNVSIDEQMDKNGQILATFPDADAVIIEREEHAEAYKRVKDKFLEMLEKSPKHCLAMILKGLGCKGEGLADQLHLGHDAANRVCKQVTDTAPDKITSFEQINIKGFKANKVGDTEYYRKEAEKLLDVLLDMYFSL